MDNVTIAEGIRIFARDVGAKLSRPDELMFEAAFPGEPYPHFIGIEMFGTMLSYTGYSGVIPNISWAPLLLKKNWGGVGDTCFYSSVHFQDNQPWHVLETRQNIDSKSTPAEIASNLKWLKHQLTIAREAIEASQTGETPEP